MATKQEIAIKNGWVKPQNTNVLNISKPQTTLNTQNNIQLTPKQQIAVKNGWYAKDINQARAVADYTARDKEYFVNRDLEAKQKEQENWWDTTKYVGSKIANAFVGAYESTADLGAAGLELAGKATSSLIKGKEGTGNLPKLVSKTGQFIFGKEAGDYKNNVLYQIGNKMRQDKIAEDINTTIDKNLQEKSKIKQDDFSMALINIISDIAATAATGKTLFGKNMANVGNIAKAGTKTTEKISSLNKIGELVKQPYIKSLFINSTSDAYKEARDKGANDLESASYAVLKGITNTAPELVFGGYGAITGKGALDDIIIDAVTNVFKSKVVNKALEFGVSGLAELGENYIQAAVDPFVNSILSGKLDFSTFKDTTDTAALTLLSTMILRSTSIPSNIKQATLQKIEEQKTKLSQQPTIQQPTIEQPIQQPTQEIQQPSIDKIVTQQEEETPGKTKIITSNNNNYLLNTNKQAKFGTDFYRNIRSIFSKKSADKITGDFDKSKLDYTNLNNKLANDLKTNIVDKYGIKKGSKDSALIQQYGEKIITLEELKQQSKNWENIVEADKYFRKQYDMLIDNINKVRKTIYPNVEENIAKYEQKLANIKDQIKLLSKQKNVDSGKIANLKLKAKSYEDILNSDDLLRNKRIEKRQDYYRHFQEVSKGFSGLKDLLTTSNDIAPSMVGISDFTKPKTKFQSIAQRRRGEKTDYDAVGGFLNYIPAASFMINIDPQISKLRTLINDIKNQMGEDTSQNKTISYLTKFVDSLAGKTSFIDRPIQELTDRRITKGIEWLSGRIKSNLILGSVSSSLSQVLNLPQIVGKIKNPVLLYNGLKKAFDSKMDYSQSQFITERYKSDILSQFDNKIINQPKKFAKWMLEALDEKVTKLGWNAFYEDAINKGIENPIQYADNNTRDMVAGRGIGEKTLLQESKYIGLIAPFTVEVGNLNRVMKDFAKSKDIAGLLIMFLVANLLNKGIEKIGGGGKTIDPIEAIKDALTEEDLTFFQKLGRVVGEFASNIPAAQMAAQLYPEFGTKTLPTRKELFGKQDPTRFGTGSMYGNILKNPVTTLLTPYGGTQIRKTIEGLNMFNKKVPGSYDKNGKLRFPIEPTIFNKAQAAIFGQYASKEAREYFDNNRRALSNNQLKQLESSTNIKKDYETMMKLREYNYTLKKYKDALKSGKDTKELEKKLEELYKNI